MKKNSLIPFMPNKKRKKSTTTDGEVVVHGKLSKLDFEVYKRGTIHITDGTLIFRKNIDLFDEDIEGIENISVSGWKKKKIHRINGAGDTDNLIFSYNEENDDLDVTLKKKEYGTIEKLKKLLSEAKVKVLS